MHRAALIACLSTIGILGTSQSGSAQVRSGYRAVDEAPLPESLVEEYDGGRFVIVIRRRSRTDGGMDLLTRAESLYPPEAVIDSAVAAHLSEQPERSNAPELFEEAAAREGERWWWYGYGDTLLPFAVTASAVRHYVERVRASSAGPNPIARYDPGVEHTARFEYEASVTSTPTGNREVSMWIQWRFYCGSLCALSFRHRRIVTFDAEGNVVSVSGDEPPSVLVS